MSGHDQDKGHIIAPGINSHGDFKTASPIYSFATRATCIIHHFRFVICLAISALAPQQSSGTVVCQIQVTAVKAKEGQS